MNKKHDRRRLIIIAIIALLALLLGVGIYCITQPKTTEIDNAETPLAGLVWDANAEEGGLTQRSEEEIRAELNEKVARGMISISMNTSPVFENGISEGNLLIVNSERNNYPQIVYIVRKDTGEEIYRSGGIPVGSKIERAKLAVDLPAGTYDCVAYFNNVDPETGAFLGTAGAEITVTVQH